MHIVGFLMRRLILYIPHFPHFYIVKLGYSCIDFFLFLILHEKTNSLHMRKQRRSCAVTTQVISDTDTLRKQAHMIYKRKTFDIFLIFAQNIDCGFTLEPPRRGGSNEYPQSIFWSKNKKNRYTPAYPSFTI